MLIIHLNMDQLESLNNCKHFIIVTFYLIKSDGKLYLFSRFIKKNLQFIRDRVFFFTIFCLPFPIQPMFLPCTYINTMWNETRLIAER